MNRKAWLDLQARGYKAFNAARKAHPRSRPNFAGISMYDQAHFMEFDLHGATLRGGSFKRASFSGADLRDADLSGAYLGYARFDRTDLRGANLSGADLRDAAFSRCNLEGANLSNANLGQATLTRSKVGETLFVGVNLGTTKGLEALKHSADSTIDVATIYRSNGRIPEAFLRGAGVPKATITHIRKIAKRPVVVDSVFVSHASKDKDTVRTLVDDLQDVGVQCFYSDSDLRPGEAFPETIKRAIQSANVFLLLLSRSALESSWVKREYEAALESIKGRNRKLRIIPVRLDNALVRRKRLPAWTKSLKESTHVMNFSPQRRGQGYWQAFSELMDAFSS